MVSVRKSRSCTTTSSYPLSLGVGRQPFLIELEHLDPIDLDVSLFAGFAMRLGLTPFFFRRQIPARFVRLDVRLALFPLEPIVLVAQTLDFFSLLLHFGVQGFH